MAGVEHRREPCPDRIVDDAGSAFAVGAVLGSMYYFTTGAWAHRYVMQNIFTFIVFLHVMLRERVLIDS